MRKNSESPDFSQIYIRTIWTSSNLSKMAVDDWKQFAMELWGLTISTWEPDPERDGKLPEPLEYDVLQDGLVELESEQRQHVLQCLSCYQVNNNRAVLCSTR